MKKPSYYEKMLSYLNTSIDKRAKELDASINSRYTDFASRIDGMEHGFSSELKCTLEDSSKDLEHELNKLDAAVNKIMDGINSNNLQ
jgi:hypothetical protein